MILEEQYKPKANGYITTKAYRFAVRWMANRGMLTDIRKAKRVKAYNIYSVHDGAYSLIKVRKCRQSAKRYIYNLFIDKYNYEQQAAR